MILRKEDYIKREEEIRKEMEEVRGERKGFWKERDEAPEGSEKWWKMSHAIDLCEDILVDLQAEWEAVKTTLEEVWGA